MARMILNESGRIFPPRTFFGDDVAISSLRALNLAFDGPFRRTIKGSTMNCRLVNPPPLVLETRDSFHVVVYGLLLLLVS